MSLRLLSIATVPVLGVALWLLLQRPPVAQAQGPWCRPLAERASDPFPRELEVAGARITVAAPPRRIVSGTVFGDEVLLAICPHERIRALHRLSEDPRFSSIAAESTAFPRHHGGDPEEILALGPDAVILSSFSRVETRNLLSGVGCAVLRFSEFQRVSDVQSNLRALGWALGLDAQAERLVQAMDETLTRIGRDKDRRAAWRVLHWEDGRASGGDTTFDSLLGWVGARNAALGLGITGSQPIGVESLLAADPDALVVGAVAGEEAALRERLRQMPGFGALRALRGDRLLVVPAGDLQSTSHWLARAAERIAGALDAWGKP